MLRSGIIAWVQRGVCREVLVNQVLRITIYGLTSLIGVLAFVYPFLLPVLPVDGMQAHAADAPLLLTALVGICFVVLVFEAQHVIGSARMVALLGTLVALNALLRFVDVLLPLPGGFSPVFTLIILAGYVFGGSFGFLTGAMTLLVSALITGGVGPWLPYQMFTAAWIGLSAPACRLPVQLLHLEGRRAEGLLLALFGAFWGLLYGAVMNIWFWPFVAGPPEQSWVPGSSLADGLQRYLLFYTATSLLWDISAAVGNLILIGVFGPPILQVLRRFRRRFTYRAEATP